jgi:antitoxin MazE
MKTKIIKIGNSRGIRIPKSFIDESGLKNEVELEINEGKIIIKPISKAREVWASAFQKMAKVGDDFLLDSDILHKQTNWDEEEWEW